MNINAEIKLQKVIYPELDKGRPNWDKPHTQAVVAYVKEIIKANQHLKLDEEVLIIAAYAHDWGYAGLFENGKLANQEFVSSNKIKHMEIGAQKIHVLLNNKEFDYLSLDKKMRIEHLVSIHDYRDRLSDTDEIILMEADTLGAADIDAVKPTFNKVDYEKWKDSTRESCISRFITNYSKKKIEELFQNSSRYFSSVD